MSHLKPLECVNCGAPLERDGLQCKYCGTRYATEGAGKDTVNLYADNAVVAKAIKRIDIKRIDLVEDPIYPLAVISAKEQRWQNTGGRGI